MMSKEKFLKYVHVTGLQSNKFIEFDFAIGDPLLYVELILPIDQFQVFCAKNKVLFLTPEQVKEVDYDRLKWRYGSPGELEEA
ncbi:MAG: phenol hydroxylase [Gammaproteobacteria bacterium]|nr:MAG: phenol hydroxylase [Gammaproteobacteria bacterium]